MRILATLTAFTLTLSGLVLAAPVLAIDTRIDALCGPDGPEAYKRAGGYCDQIGANKSATGGSDGGGCTDYIIVLSHRAKLGLNEPVLVAENCVIVDDEDSQ